MQVHFAELVSSNNWLESCASCRTSDALMLGNLSNQDGRLSREMGG